MKVLVCIPLSTTQLGRLRASVAGADILFHPEPDAEGRTAFEASEVVFGNPPVSWIGTATELRWIQLESVGFGEYADLDWKTMKAAPVVTNLAGFFTEAVAESILAGILAQYRGMARLQTLQDRRSWVGDPVRTTLATLQAAHVVFLGRGDINRRVAELLAPFHCSMAFFGRGFDPVAFDNSLSGADIVICTVPHTSETRGLFDRERISKIKRGALFLNFGRGSLLDEDALADALASGQLGGAVIDVTKDEPLPANHRCWSAPNMLLTQHTAGGSADEIDRKIEHFVTNFARYRNHEPLLHVVDFEKGY